MRPQAGRVETGNAQPLPLRKAETGLSRYPHGTSKPRLGRLGGAHRRSVATKSVTLTGSISSAAGSKSGSSSSRIATRGGWPGSL